MRISLFLGVSLFAITSLFCIEQTSAHQGATGIVKERMDGFKMSQKKLKAIPKAVKSGDFSEVEALGNWLADWGDEMPKLFPQGSLQPPSEASPLIWENFANFEAKSKQFVLASQTLVEGAKSQDKAAIMDSFKNLAASCTSCHSAYRLK